MGDAALAELCGATTFGHALKRQAQLMDAVFVTDELGYRLAPQDARQAFPDTRRHVAAALAL